MVSLNSLSLLPLGTLGDLRKGFGDVFGVVFYLHNGADAWCLACRLPRVLGGRRASAVCGKWIVYVDLLQRRNPRKIRFRHRRKRNR